MNSRKYSRDLQSYSENNAEKDKMWIYDCLEGDEPPIDAVMILAKKSLPLFFFSVGFYGTAQINGSLMQQRVKNFKDLYFFDCEQKKEES